MRAAESYAMQPRSRGVARSSSPFETRTLFSCSSFLAIEAVPLKIGDANPTPNPLAFLAPNRNSVDRWWEQILSLRFGSREYLHSILQILSLALRAGIEYVEGVLVEQDLDIEGVVGELKTKIFGKVVQYQHEAPASVYRR